MVVETTGILPSKTPGGFRVVCLDCKQQTQRVKVFHSDITREKWIVGHSRLHGHYEFAIEENPNDWETRQVG